MNAIIKMNVWQMAAAALMIGGTLAAPLRAAGLPVKSRQTIAFMGDSITEQIELAKKSWADAKPAK